MSRQPTITVRDIAERIGVAPSTVTRALAGDPRLSRQRIREIRRLAAKLGYQPRPMRSKRTRALGLIVPASDDDRPNEYVYRVMRVAFRAAARRSRHIHIHFVDKEARATGIPDIVRENRVDGVLLAGHPDAKFCKALKKTGIPAVAINDTVTRTGFSCVLSNPRPAVQEGIDRLVALGHKRFGFTVQTLEYPSIRRRYEAVRDGLASAGVRLDPALVLENVSATMADGEAALDRFGATDGGAPTAIICTSEATALGILCALLRRGRDVPKDHSLFALGESSTALNMKPQLSTMNPQLGEIADEAVALLLELIDDPHHETIQRDVVCGLNWRDSCGDAPRGGR